MKNQFQRCSKKRGVLKNFANFMGKHLCQSLFIKKVAGPMINMKRGNVNLSNVLQRSLTDNYLLHPM